MPVGVYAGRVCGACTRGMYVGRVRGACMQGVYMERVRRACTQGVYKGRVHGACTRGAHSPGRRQWWADWGWAVACRRGCSPESSRGIGWSGRRAGCHWCRGSSPWWRWWCLSTRRRRRASRQSPPSPANAITAEHTAVTAQRTRGRGMVMVCGFI